MTEGPRNAAPQVPDALLEEGAIWFARLRGPDANDFRSEFENWLAESTLHQAAYERAGEIFAAGRFLAAERRSRTNVANDNVRPSGESLKWLVAATIVGLGIAMIAMVIQQRAMGVPGGADHSGAPQISGASENRSYLGPSGPSQPIRLSDGSVITLKPGSVLTQSFGPDRRELRLEKGEARFEVAHEHRPFVVQAGGGSVTARGTIFDVRMGDGRQVIVNLLRGAIDVERPTQSDGISAPYSRLSAGESLAFRSDGGVSNLGAHGAAAPQTADAIDYSKPREFDRTPLAAVLAETRTASGITILIADPNVGQMRVSGRFRVDNGQQVADRLAALFDLKIEQTSASQVTLRREN